MPLNRNNGNKPQKRKIIFRVETPEETDALTNTLDDLDMYLRTERKGHISISLLPKGQFSLGIKVNGEYENIMGDTLAEVLQEYAKQCDIGPSFTAEA